MQRLGFKITMVLRGDASRECVDANTLVIDVVIDVKKMHSFYTANFVNHNHKSQNIESNQHRQLSPLHSTIVIGFKPTQTTVVVTLKYRHYGTQS
jgi:hypothetical protein